MSAFTLHLLRHGVPEQTGLLMGHTDMPLATRPAPLLAERLRALDLRRIVTSDLSRARQGAQDLADRLHLPLRVDPLWRELDFGDWDGLLPDAVAPEALSRFQSDPDACPPPGGERWSTLCQRVGTALQSLADGTLIVTHAGAMRAALSVLTGLNHRDTWALELPYHARLSLRVWPGLRLAGQVIALEQAPVP